MTAPAWATGPIPFAIDIIADDIAADFAARGITAKVVVGAWERFKEDASARVVLGLGDADGDTVRGRRFGPGIVVDMPGGKKARALWASVQRFNVWIAHPPNAATAPEQRAREARALTWRLTNATLAAMWRSHGGQFDWGSLRWSAEDDGTRTYGGALSLVAKMDLAVTDDACDVIVPAEGQGSSTMDHEDADITDAPPFIVEPDDES